MDKTAAEALLCTLDGEWEGLNRTWFEPDVLSDESTIRATIRALPGTPSVLYEYDSQLQGRPFRGAALFAFNTFTGHFEGAWSDSFHMTTNMMVSRGGACPGGFSLLGAYHDPGGGPAWGWRTVVVQPDADHVVVTAYNITPSGDESKATEARLTRRA